MPTILRRPCVGTVGTALRAFAHPTRSSSASSLRGAKRRSNPDLLLDSGLLRFARNDELTRACGHVAHAAGPSTAPIHLSNSLQDKHPRSRGLIRPSFASDRPRNKGGRREGRAPTAPMVACKKHAVVTTGTSRTSGLPCAMVYTLYVISPGTGFLAPVCDNALSARCAGLSTGRPGPHDFGVRAGLRSSAQPSRPSQPASHIVTTRTPLFDEAGCAEMWR